MRHQIAAFGVETAPAGITVIAMGRYGGREVNFSSDADAILIYRPADDADDGQANAFAKRSWKTCATFCKARRRWSPRSNST